MYDPIKKNKVSLFIDNFSPPKESCKTSQQLSSMKSDCTLFERLGISCQTRDGDLDEFFKHENGGFSPSLSHLGKLRLPTKKYELTECLEANTTGRTGLPSAIDATIIDGAVCSGQHDQARDKENLFRVCQAIILAICKNTAPSC